MAVTLSALTSGTDTTDGTGFSTASVSPATDDVLLVGVATTAGASAPTLTGLGATWTLVDSAESIQRRIDVFRAQIPAGTSGAITITYGASVDHCSWAVIDCDGAQTGNNGADAIELTAVVEGTTNVTSASVDVSGLEAGATIGFAAHQRTAGITSGQTSLWNFSTSSPSGRYSGGWDSTGAGTISFTVSTASIWTVVGVRVIEASSSSDATVTPSVVDAAGTIEAPTVTATSNATVTPAAVTVDGLIANASGTASAAPAPETIDADGSLPAPTVSRNVTIAVAVVDAAGTVESVTVSASSTVTATVVDAVGSVESVTVTAGTGATITATLVTADVDVPAPSVAAGGNASVLTSVVTGDGEVLAASASSAASVVVAVVNADGSVESVSIFAGAVADDTVTATVYRERSHATVYRERSHATVYRQGR